MKLYAIIDEKSGLTSIFPSAGDGYAVRTLQTSPSENSPMYMFPEDFRLVCVGEVDEKNGDVSPLRYEVCGFNAIYTKDTI